MNQPAQQSPLLVTRILWAAMLMSIFLYVGLTFVLTMPEGFEAEAHTQAVFIGSFAVVSLSILGVTFVLRQVMFFRKFEKGDLTADSAPAAYQTVAIVSFAMAEAIALFGFVLHMTTYDPVAPLPFFGLGLVLLLMLYPKEDHLIGRGF
ncbi:MAG: hypothetical protein AAGI01_12005 [Myxococcota bacterium]